MPLGPDQQAALIAIGYTEPTPIQQHLIPLALTGRDVIGQAQTGTGKTAAFLLPIFHRLDCSARYPQAIVLAPTRELAVQVVEEGSRLVGEQSIRLAAIYGGMPFDRQVSQLNAGAQVVVGTPGRCLDHIRRGTLNLRNIRTVVLDEADRMLDIGFRPDIESILRRVSTDRQTLLLSATMPPPVRRLAEKYMRDPEMIDLAPDRLSVDTIEQRYFTVEEDRKLGLLLRLLVRERPRQCIIFCQMKSAVRSLARELGRRISGVTAMQGDMQQSMRNRVMDGFRKGNIRILVATDIVGRGIDVSGISHVINYDIPEDPENYVHRIGRTGRMGRDGRAFTFVTPDQGRDLTTIEHFINAELIRDSIEGYVTHRGRESQVIEAAAPVSLSS